MRVQITGITFVAGLALASIGPVTLATAEQHVDDSRLPSQIAQRPALPDDDMGQCHFESDRNGTQIKICEKGASVGGQIKGVSTKYPLGKNGAIPTAGKQIEQVAHKVRDTVETGAHKTSKWIAKRMGW